MRPVAVLIDYQDWQTIEQILETYQAQQIEEFSINKYAGVIKLTQDPLEYQQEVSYSFSSRSSEILILNRNLIME
jgi:hypothetical protein